MLLLIFGERGKERKTEIETAMRNIKGWLPLACPLLGNKPTTQACVLAGIELGASWCMDCRSATEQYRPGLFPFLINEIQNLESRKMITECGHN